MKKSFFKQPIILCALLGLSVPLLADVPKPKPVARYKELWTNSRITKKPDPVTEEEINELDDYTLLSVTPLGDQGHMVVIKDKKDAAASRVRILPGQQNKDGFKVEKVEQSPSGFMDTKVTLSLKGKTGVVGYEEKFLTLSRAQAPAQANANRNNRNANQRNTPNPANRNNANGNNNNANNRGLPPAVESALNRNRQNNQQNNGRTQPNANNNGNSSNNGNSTQRRPRVRRVPTPPTTNR